MSSGLMRRRGRRLCPYDHVIVHYTDPSIAGGVETVIGDFMRLAQRQGERTLLLAGAGDLKSHGMIHVQHEPLLDANNGAIRSANERILAARSWSEAGSVTAGLKKRLAEIAPKGAIWHLHNIATNTLNLPLVRALYELLPGRHRWRTIAWTWDTHWMWPESSARDHRWLYKVIGRPWPRVQYCVATRSRRARLLRAGFPASNVHLVRPYIDLDRVLGLGQRISRLAHEHGLFRADIVVVYACRLSERKRIESALAVVSHLKQRHKQSIRFVITGFETPHRPEHSKSYRERLGVIIARMGLDREVVFAAREDEGALEWPEVLALLRIADVALMTSRDEGFGLAALEAAVNEVPIVASRRTVGKQSTFPYIWTFNESASIADIAQLVSQAAARRRARREAALEASDDTLMAVIGRLAG